MVHRGRKKIRLKSISSYQSGAGYEEIAPENCKLRNRTSNINLERVFAGPVPGILSVENNLYIAWETGPYYTEGSKKGSLRGEESNEMYLINADSETEEKRGRITSTILLFRHRYRAPSFRYWAEPRRKGGGRRERLSTTPDENSAGKGT